MRARKTELTALAVYLILYLLSFFLLERLITPEYIIHCELDDWIPFCKWAMIPYCLWFLWIPTVVLRLMWKEPEAFWRLFWCIALGSALALTIYALFPNGVDLRQPVAGTGLMSQAVRLLYRVDTSTNVCPSLHVYMSCCACFAVLRSQTLRREWGVHLALTLAVSASTVLLDQHSVIDVACGILLWLVVDALVHTARPRLVPGKANRLPV